MIACILRPYAIWQPSATVQQRCIGTLLDEYGQVQTDIWRRCVAAYAAGHPVEIYRMSNDDLNIVADLVSEAAAASTPIVGGSLSLHTVYYKRGEPTGYGVQYLLPPGS